MAIGGPRIIGCKPQGTGQPGHPNGQNQDKILEGAEDLVQPDWQGELFFEEPPADVAEQFLQGSKRTNHSAECPVENDHQGQENKEEHHRSGKDLA